LPLKLACPGLPRATVTLGPSVDFLRATDAGDQQMSCEPESSVVPFCRSLGDLHIRRLPGMRVQVVKPAAARLPAAVCPLSALHLHQHEDCSPWIVSPDEGIIEEVYDLVLVQALPAATRGLGRHWHPSGAPLLVRWRTKSHYSTVSAASKLPGMLRGPPSPFWRSVAGQHFSHP
jgi:hypothetical protein